MTDLEFGTFMKCSQCLKEIAESVYNICFNHGEMCQSNIFKNCKIYILEIQYNKFRIKNVYEMQSMLKKIFKIIPTTIKILNFPYEVI